MQLLDRAHESNMPFMIDYQYVCYIYPCHDAKLNVMLTVQQTSDRNHSLKALHRT